MHQPHRRPTPNRHRDHQQQVQKQKRPEHRPRRQPPSEPPAAQQRLTEVVPAVPVYESQLTIAYRRDVKGVVFDSSHNVPFFTSVWLDREPQP